MEVLTTLGRTLGFSFSAGINLYATVAILGLASRYGWVDLPPQFKVFDHDVVIVAALIMYAIEFVADKVPWVDSLWDTVHTAIRPIGGALVAVSTFGETSPAVTGLIALARRYCRCQHPRDQGRHPRGRQHESGADLELDPQLH